MFGDRQEAKHRERMSFLVSLSSFSFNKETKWKACGHLLGQGQSRPVCDFVPQETGDFVSRNLFLVLEKISPIPDMLGQGETTHLLHPEKHWEHTEFKVDGNSGTMLEFWNQACLRVCVWCMVVGEDSTRSAYIWGDGGRH